MTLELTRRSAVLPVAILLLASALRFHRVENQNVWWDEGWNVSMARSSIPVMVERTARDFTPPLHYALLHVWLGVAGESEFALRSLSVFAGVLATAATYRLAARLGGRGAGGLAALLTAVARTEVWWSQEIRPYALAATLAVLSADAAVAWLSRSNPRTALYYVFSMAAGYWTVFFFAGISLAQNAAMLAAWLWHRWRSVGSANNARAGNFPWRGWVGLQAIVGVLFLPWVLYYLPRRPHWEIAPSPPLTSLTAANLYLSILTVGVTEEIGNWLPVAYGLTVLALLGGLRAVRRSRPTVSFGVMCLASGVIAFGGILWFLTSPLAGFARHGFAARYVVMMVPWFFALLAVGISQLAGRWRHLAVLAAGGTLLALAIPTFAHLTHRHLSDDYRTAATIVAALRRPEDNALLHNDSDWPLAAFHLGEDWPGVPNGEKLTSHAFAEQILKDRWESGDGLWLMLSQYALSSDPDQHIVGWLKSRAVAYRHFDTGADAQLYFFARTFERAAIMDQPLTGHRSHRGSYLSPAPGLTLADAQWALNEYTVGESIQVILIWDQANAIGQYDLALRLVNPQGDLALEVPITLTVSAETPGTFLQFVRLPVWPGTGPGRYDLVVVGGEHWARLGSLQVMPEGERAREFEAPENSTAARFEGGIRLLGYSAHTEGERLQVNLYWSVDTPAERRYKRFVHLLGSTVNPATGNELWGQTDGEPGNGGEALTTWHPSELIMDSLGVVLPPDLPGGEYTLSVGWYDMFSGERLMRLNAAGEIVDSRAELGPILIDR